MLIMMYSHDSFGLGHIRRTLELATQLSDKVPETSLVIVTGSMQAHAYPLPPRTEYIKLPALTKNGAGHYCSRSLPHHIDTTIDLRRRIIFESVSTLKPDIFLVDKSPAGILGELLPSLEYCKTHLPQTKLVLGMRDIEDAPAQVLSEWGKSGVVPLLESTYDAIFLYGTTALYDPIQEYGLSPRVRKKLISCGYIGRSDDPSRATYIPRDLRLRSGRFVLVTPGGGEDGYAILETYVRMLRLYLRSDRPQFDSVIVTGPLMSPEQRSILKQAAGEDLALTVLDFTPDLYAYLRLADLVVSMSGYNTIVEILSANRRAVVIPRVSPRLEQYIRAERLAQRGLIEMIHPENLTPDNLFETISRSLQRPRPARAQDVGIELNGAATVCTMINRWRQGTRLSHDLPSEATPARRGAAQADQVTAVSVGGN